MPTTPKPLNLGPTLLRLRKEQGISQLQLAREAITTNTRIRGYERNESDPHLWTLQRLCTALGYKVSDVIRMAEEDN